MPEDYLEPIKATCHELIEDAIAQEIALEDSEKQLIDLLKNVESDLFLASQQLVSFCIILLGEKSLAHWSLIEHATLRSWRLSGVPVESQSQVLEFEEMIVDGFEKESQQHEETPPHLKIDATQNLSVPELAIYRKSYQDFYQELSNNDLLAIHDAEQTIASNQIAIGQQIYRVRIILNVYGQRKFMQWLKMICCKICHISWRKAYDLMYAYESRHFVEKVRPDLLPIFDYQLRHFQCEARRSKDELIPVLEEAQEDNRRYTLDEVKNIFSQKTEEDTQTTEEEKQEKQIVGELKMPVRKLLDKNLINGLSSYIYKNPDFTVQFIISKAVENWLHQHY